MFGRLLHRLLALSLLQRLLHALALLAIGLRLALMRLRVIRLGGRLSFRAFRLSGPLILPTCPILVLARRGLAAGLRLRRILRLVLA